MNAVQTHIPHLLKVMGKFHSRKNKIYIVYITRNLKPCKELLD